MVSKKWVSKVEVGGATVVLQKLQEHQGVMVSGDLFRELGLDKKAFRSYLSVLKRADLIRFSDWYPYEKTFHVRMVETTKMPIA